MDKDLHTIITLVRAGLLEEAASYYINVTNKIKRFEVKLLTDRVKEKLSKEELKSLQNQYRVSLSAN